MAASLRKLVPVARPVAVLCWLALLASMLLRAGAAPGQLTPPDWLILVAQAGFAAGIFLHERARPDRLRGTEFVPLLRQLLVWPGALAAVCVVLHLTQRLLATQAPDRSAVLLNTFYVVNLGLFVYFLARTCYTWRSLVFFRSQPRTRQEWRWFELLLGVALMFRLVSGDAMSWFILPVLVVLAGLGVYLSAHQQWVAYLSRRQKWEVVFLQLAILGVMSVFLGYFLLLQQAPGLAGPLAQHAFLVLTSFFAGFYAVMGFLVTLFNLPTAGVFEQKREEILSMQRLSQLIQKGQSEKEVYQLLFDASVQTVECDAAWLDLAEDGSNPVLSHRIDPAARASICDLLADYNIGNIEYLNNDLPNSAGFRALQLPYSSLIVMPLRAEHNYGTLYLLKEARQGFDRENLSLLQIFTSQTVIRVENLRLMAESLHNERVKEELKIASVVQQRLIPKTLPVDSWFEIRWHSLPAREVGGDFYDFLQLSASRIAIIIGDVSGKGTTAAFHVAQMKGIFHSLMLLDKPEKGQPLQPSKFMAMANQALSHCLERSSFITASFYIVDYKERGFAFARAGHCHTLYYNAITEETFYFQTEGLGLGILRDAASYEKRIKNMYYDYNPGDVMVMYTDGIVEARNAQEEEYGEDRLRQLLERSHYLEAEEIKQSIIRDLEEFSRGLPPFDDQTLLVIKFKNAQPLA